MMQSAVIPSIVGLVVLLSGTAVTGLGARAEAPACPAARDESASEAPPPWAVGAAPTGEGGARALYGVGREARLQQPAMRRRAAEGKARGHVAQGFTRLLGVAKRQYVVWAATQRVAPIAEESLDGLMKGITAPALAAVCIEAVWVPPDAAEGYALARLDVEAYRQAVRSMPVEGWGPRAQGERVRDFLLANAERTFDEFKKEPGRP